MRRIAPKCADLQERQANIKVLIKANAYTVQNRGKKPSRIKGRRESCKETRGDVYRQHNKNDVGESGRLGVSEERWEIEAERCGVGKPGEVLRLLLGMRVLVQLVAVLLLEMLAQERG